MSLVRVDELSNYRQFAVGGNNAQPGCAGAVPLAVEQWLSGPGRNNKKGQDYPAQRLGLLSQSTCQSCPVLGLFTWLFQCAFRSLLYICPMSSDGVAFNSSSFCGLIIIVYSAKTHFLVPTLSEVSGTSCSGPIWLSSMCTQAAAAGLCRSLSQSCSLPSSKKSNWR